MNKCLNLKQDTNIFLLHLTSIYLQLTVNSIIIILHAFHFLLQNETELLEVLLKEN